MRKQEFIKKLINKNIHINDDGSLFYDYFLIPNKIKSSDKVKIICSKHGEFEQRVNSHLLGKGCKQCGIEKINQQKTKTTEQFITEAKLIHNDKYDYSLVEYKHSQEKVKIICPEHGEFEQQPNNHLSYKSGCPVCASEQTVSKPEKYLREFINNQLNIETINNSRNILDNNKEIDIFIKNKNIGFEFNGIFTHSLFHKNKGNNYHYKKFNDALSKGIKLYSIFEDSFINNINSVKSFVIKKLMVKEQLLFIDDFSRNNVIFDDLKLQTFLLENQLNYRHTNENNIYHCLFDKNKEIVKCYIIDDINTIIDIVEKNYVFVNDDIKYFTDYKLMIDLFYQSPLEEQFKHLKVEQIIKPQIICKEKYDIENCGYIVYGIK